MKITRILRSLNIYTTALAGVTLFISSPAHAQMAEISGDNSSFTGGCYAVFLIPNTCATQIITPLADTSGPTLLLGNTGNTGVMIGTNLSNNHSGPAASGSATILDGGSITSGYLYIGYENNTSGDVLISGPGSIWSSYSAGIVGHYGEGNFSILGGGQYTQINTDYFYVGYGATGSGTVTVSGADGDGNRSSLITRNRIYIGDAGDANVSILDGGLVSAEYTSIIALQESSNAYLTVSGVNQATGESSTFRVVNNQLWVGDGGHGTLDVSDGGLVEVQSGIHLGGEWATGVGALRVNGVDEVTGRRSTVNSNSINVGYNGTGTAFVTDGGIVNTNSLSVGRFDSSSGDLSVSGINNATGDRSTINVNQLAYVGSQAVGKASVAGGGLLNISGDLIVGSTAQGIGAINVSDAGSEVIVLGSAVIGDNGSGTLNLSNQGSFIADNLQIANSTTSVGVLSIGTGGQAGILDTSMITGGQGTATINFNHIDEIDFVPAMTGNLDVNQMNSGATTLAIASDYTGLTTISAGALKAGGVNFFSANSDHAVEENGTLDLNGHSQTLSNIDNAGLVRFGGTGGTILEVSETYTGNGGVIVFNTVLGDDASVTDMMIVDEAEGASFIRVNNAGGIGAQTNEGIKLIEVLDESFATFSLLGDYVFEGDQAVVGGAYAYRLYEGATSEPDDGNWYLRSSLMPEDPVDPETPLYQPGVPIYESYAQSLLGLNGVSTLQQRVGNRFWSGDGNRVISQGADAIETYAPVEEAGVHIDNSGFWGRIEGAHNKFDPKHSTSGADFSQNMFRLQAGADMLLSENADGMLIGGVFAHYVHGKTKVRSIYGDGQISSDGYGFGGTLTWYGNEGFYVDAQAQATWYDSNLSSSLAGTSLVTGNKGFGYALSIETGKSFAITPEWSVTPQAQITYSNVSFDGFNDVWGTHVSLDKGSSFQGRLGVTLDHEASWQNDAGLTNRAHVYGIANLYYGFSEGTKVDVASVQFRQEQERLWGGFGLGGSYNWNDDRYSIFGEGLVNTSLSNFGDSYALKGNVGLRVKW